MNKKILLIFIVALISIKSLGQNMIYKGGQQYKATNQWVFKCENYSWRGDLQAQIAKNTKGGYLRLSIEVADKRQFIGGSVYLFLSDGSTIVCTDKGMKDHVDQKSVAMYILTEDEINKLKYIDIQKIRFTIKEKPNQYPNQSENFTAMNKKNKSLKSIYENKVEKDYYETSVEVSALFD